MAGLIICGYLAIGGLIAASFVYVLKVGIEMAEDGHEEPRAAVRDMEATVSRTPGHMVGVIIMLTLLWPLAVAIYIRSAAKRWM